VENLDSLLLRLPDAPIAPEKLPVIGPKLASLEKEEEILDRAEGRALGVLARRAYNRMQGKLPRTVRYSLLSFVVKIEHLIGANIPVDPS